MPRNRPRSLTVLVLLPRSVCDRGKCIGSRTLCAMETPRPRAYKHPNRQVRVLKPSAGRCARRHDGSFALPSTRDQIVGRTAHSASGQPAINRHPSTALRQRCLHRAAGRRRSPCPLLRAAGEAGEAVRKSPRKQKSYGGHGAGQICTARSASVADRASTSLKRKSALSSAMAFVILSADCR